MRELKYRAWDTESKCYIELNNLRGERSIYFSPYDLRAIPPEIRDNVVLEQYTGLKDRNEKKIFEGDIVKRIKTHQVFRNVAEVEIFRIRWGVRKAGFFAYSKERKKHSIPAKRLNANDVYVVIGNIHESPELIEKEE